MNIQPFEALGVLLFEITKTDNPISFYCYVSVYLIM